MKKFEVIEIEYDQLREDLRSNCEELIEQNNILFNYDQEQDQYIAYVKFDPGRARSLDAQPRKSDTNSRLLRRKKKPFASSKYGIFNDFPFKPRKPPRAGSPDPSKPLIKSSKQSPSPKKKQPKAKILSPTEETQAVFHESCLKPHIESRAKVKRIKSSVVYKPSIRGRSADLARKINNLPGESGQRRVPRRTKKNEDNRGYKQVGKWRAAHSGG